MPETAKIIEAVNGVVNGIHKSINTGFDTVHQKIDKKFKQCDDRVTKIETTLAVKKALCEKKKENEKQKVDYWQYIIRSLSVAGILALLIIAGKLFLFGLTL